MGKMCTENWNEIAPMPASKTTSKNKQPVAALCYVIFCFLVSTYFLVDMLRGSPDYLIYVVNDYEIE